MPCAGWFFFSDIVLNNSCCFFILATKGKKVHPPFFLLNPPFVEGLLIAACIGIVLGEGGGEVVGAGEVFLGAHVEVVVAGWIEHGFEGCHGGDADGAWREAFIYIGIVGGVDGEVLVKNAAQGRVTGGELHSGVCLEEHVTLQTVEIETCHNGFLGIDGGLLVYNGGDGGYLEGCEPEGIGLLEALGCPIGGVLTLEALNEVGDGDVPIDLVGVGDEE